jgi:toxin ParE1/3/4
MTVRIEFSRRALEQFEALYHYIESASSPAIAARYTSAVFDYCLSLQTFPMRGTGRDDIRPGVRVTNYRKRTVIAFAADTDHVLILGVFHGGQDYESTLYEEPGT